ncbi:MAG TPA: transposase [Methanoregulaceae archaeon]|nr:transposase [Methanoregulaceae archaeon]
MDLNTTGHLAVLAEPVTGFVLRLGQAGSLFSHHIEFPVGPGRSRRLIKLRNRLRALEKAICLKVSREIVRVARRLACGIKFERLFSRRLPPKDCAARPFLQVQQMVEARARRAGLPVLYVDPTATSKRCHRCGAVGHRHRKRFECPACGLVAHADVNAAINIAVAPCRCPEKPRLSPSRRSLRREARSTAGPGVPPEGLLALLDGRVCGPDGIPRSAPIPGKGPSPTPSPRQRG